MTILRKQENKEGEWIMIIKGLDYSFQSMELSEFCFFNINMKST